MPNNIDIGIIQKVSLRELWGEEDRDFTRWLENNIDYLNELLNMSLTVISREQNVGPFKVDLYAEDGNGNKVIIENQLERTDHTHLGQIITYLTNLEANVAIWIASNPTAEHTEAIEWLNEISPENISFYLIKIEAIKIEDQPAVAPLFTIVSAPTEQGRQLGSEKKEHAQRHVYREKFWAQFLNEINKKNQLFANVSPSTDNWISIGVGRGGIGLNLVVSKRYARVEIYINRGDKDENKRVFDEFFKQKDEIEKNFGDELVWERMEENVTSRIKYELGGVSIFNEEDWPKMNKFLIDNVEKMHQVFREAIRRIKI